jgi:hypothetical protein
LLLWVGIGVGDIAHVVDLPHAAHLPEGPQVDAQHGLEHAEEDVVRRDRHEVAPDREAIKPAGAEVAARLLRPQIDGGQFDPGFIRLVTGRGPGDQEGVFVGWGDLRLPEANFLARGRLAATGDRETLLSDQPALGNAAEGHFVISDRDGSAITAAVQADGVDRGTELDLIDKSHSLPPARKNEIPPPRTRTPKLSSPPQTTQAHSPKPDRAGLLKQLVRR